MKVKYDQMLSDYTTIGIGGPVPVVYLPETVEELSELLRALTAEQRAYRIIGNGSNVLADDRGIREALVCTRSLQRIFEVKEDRVIADAGYPMAQLAYQTASRGLSGLEFAVGIPGSVGGVVRMNAGAHHHSIGEFVESVTVILRDGNLRTLSTSELAFSYRSTSIPENALIASVQFRLYPDDSKKIHERIRTFNDQRTSSQPLKEKSAGCIFRNPGPCSAGKLIDDSGLKGFGIGGAVVSPLHANFIVNRNKASFQDVLDLIAHIKETVREKQGQELHEEVMIWRYE